MKAEWNSISQGRLGAMSKKTTSYADSPFVALLHEQIRHEFGAQHQYLALAVWFDANDLPRLAAHFYRQASEERGHALMMVRYLLDRDVPVHIPGIADVRTEFSRPIELLTLAMEQEKTVTAQVETLFKVAREQGDVIGEQFVLWFLKEQVEEISAMSTLVKVAERSGDQPMWIEDFLAREAVGDSGRDPLAPPLAGA